MARIKEMKQKKKNESSKEFSNIETEDFGFSMDSPIEISPMQTQNIKLETVNEQDEIFHQSMKNYERKNSSSSDSNPITDRERMLVAQFLQAQKKKELGLLNSFKAKISNLKEMLKKEIAIKFVLLEKSKKLHAENTKLRDLFGTNILNKNKNFKEVSCQVSIGSSCMANELTKKGSIGKFYKEKYNNQSKSKGSQEITVELRQDSEKSNRTTRNQNETVRDLKKLNQGIPESRNHTSMSNTSEKQKKKIKPQSTNPRVRRRSRVDRTKGKQKKSALKDLGPGTTIIVIQKNEESQETFQREIGDFNTLEEEIQKIRNDAKPIGAKGTKYKSENRVKQKLGNKNQSFIYTQKKGKPPLVSPNSKDVRKNSQIPRLGETKASIKSKRNSLAVSSPTMKSQKSSSRTNSKDSKLAKPSSKTSTDTVKHQKRKDSTTQHEKNTQGIDDLIEQKKQALGIKPLDSTMKNYKQVLNENKKLQKLVEEQKQKLRKMRQERVQQIQEMKKEKEEKKKLEQYIKHDTPVKGRKNRSGYRKGSRECSNTSNDSKMLVTSPNYRYKSEYTKAKAPRTDDFKLYGLESTEKAKGRGSKNKAAVQQPKIGGREHSEIISTEILKKSTQQLLQTSFNNPEKIDKIHKMEKYDDDYEKSVTNYCSVPLKKSMSYSESQIIVEKPEREGSKGLKKSFK